jgi:hypothetical protein
MGNRAELAEHGLKLEFFGKCAHAFNKHMALRTLVGNVI